MIKMHQVSLPFQKVRFYGCTYGGHPMACAVALKNIEIIERENLVENSKQRGEELLAGTKKLQSKHPIVV